MNVYLVLFSFILICILGVQFWLKVGINATKKERELIRKTEEDIKTLEIEAKLSRKKIKELKNEKNPVTNGISIDELTKLSNGIKRR